MINPNHETGAVQPTLKTVQQGLEELADAFLTEEGRECFSAGEMFALIRVVVERSSRELRTVMYPFQQP